MVRALLITATFLLSSCYTFDTVPEFHAGAPDGGINGTDTDTDVAAPDADGPRECDSVGEQCSADVECGPVIDCVCGECADAEFHYVALGYGAGLAVQRDGTLGVTASDQLMASLDGGPGLELDDDADTGELALGGELVGYASEDRDVMVFVDQNAAEAIFALRRRFVPPGALQGDWFATGIVDGASVGGELEIGADSVVISGELGGVDVADVALEYEPGTGQIDASVDGTDFEGQVGPDGDLILLRSGTQFILLGRKPLQRRDLDGEWLTTIIADGLSARGPTTVRLDATGEVTGELKVHDAEAGQMSPTSVSGSISASLGKWESTLADEDGPFASVSLDGWVGTRETLLGSTQDRPGITIWFKQPR